MSKNISRQPAAPGFVHRLAPHVYLVKAPEQARFPFCNGFLFTERETVLVDAGLPAAMIRELDGWRRIDTLLISHSHPDHILSWHLLDDRRLLLPAETPEEVHDLTRLGIRFTGTPEKGRYWTRRVAHLLGVRALREPDACYRNGEILTIGGARLEPVHAPGHIRDHYCFLDHRSGTLLTTDIDLTSFGPWYGNPEGDPVRFRKDIERVRALPCRRVCSSHKEPVEGRAVSQFDRYLVAFDRQRQAVLTCCDRRPQSIEELTARSPLYRNRMPDKALQAIFEGNMIRKNLALLIKEGLVEETAKGIVRTGEGHPAPAADGKRGSAGRVSVQPG
jgi:hydroxyacylglutathione hydrolase